MYHCHVFYDYDAGTFLIHMTEVYTCILNVVPAKNTKMYGPLLVWTYFISSRMKRDWAEQRCYVTAHSHGPLFLQLSVSESVIHGGIDTSRISNPIGWTNMSSPI